MVAELTDIYTTNVERTPVADRLWRRPKWIETATREPIYSVLDVNEPAGARVKHLPFPYPNKNPLVVVISAVVKEGHDRNLPKDLCPKSIKKYDKNTIGHDRNNDLEEHALYSVVKKRREVRSVVKTQRDEEQLERWLHLTSRRTFSSLNYPFDEMYANENDNAEDNNEDRKDYTNDKGHPCPNAVAVPRGIVGLVGPYRVYQNPNEKREYMLREEELVEEDVVDSVSDVDVSRKNSRSAEPHRRAKWKIREDDEEILVPDIRRLPSSFQEYEIDGTTEELDKVGLNISEWKMLDERCTEREIDDTNFQGNGNKVEGILFDKEERVAVAVDVDVDAKGISSVDGLLTKEGKANNEQQDKDSLNETASTTGGNVEGVPSGTPPGRGERNKENESVAAQPSSSSPPSRSLVSRILARARSPNDLLDHTEPFSQLWIVLSNVYGELLIVLMMALCLAEVMDTPVPLLSLQGIFLMYLYVGSIAVIIGIYIWVLFDSCASLNGTRSGMVDVEIGGTSVTRFGSLKRAHISRSRTAPTSFYIRVGALLFGLATLVFNGLEMAMHSMMQGAECLSDVIFAHPVLHGLFTFLQMHFLFVNSQVLVERFGLAARFGFTHLAATNIAVWVRLVIWDSAQEWTYFVYLAQRGSQTSASTLNLRGFPGSLTRHSRDLLVDSSSDDRSVFRPYRPISNEQISQVIALQECLNTNTLGQLWTSSLPFLYPFIVQFSLIAAAVTFVMGQNVGRSRVPQKQKFHGNKDITSHARVGCDGSSKGLFLGILCMVAGIVVILIFLVVREDEHFSTVTLSWLTCGTLIGILALSGLMTSTGLIQIRQMPVVTRAPAALDNLLSNVAIFGVQLYSIFTIVVCACSLALLEAETLEEGEENVDSSFSFGASKIRGQSEEGNAIQTRGRHIMLLSASILQLIQCFAQSTLIAETSRRSCITRFQMLAKPGRQVITFLLFSNAVLWAFDTVITQNWISQELQLRFFGVLVWGILSRIGLPLLIFYRFHSCVLLLEAWNKCYRTPRGEHPLN
ncbi:proton channel OtopLc-like [Vespa velutina]|uniref:proton channel OtopLc-like n=1 Tax=Vespa velutina TaxID=202808 RepID=UPI001FB385F3|nr:proton channel OtopLc-like [Vespa velutina]